MGAQSEHNKPHKRLMETEENGGGVKSAGLEQGQGRYVARAPWKRKRKKTELLLFSVRMWGGAESLYNKRHKRLMETEENRGSGKERWP